MFKEQLHKSFDAISPSPELLDRISAMMSEEAARPKPSIKMNAVKYGGIAAALALAAGGTVFVLNNANNGIATTDTASKAIAAETVGAAAADNYDGITEAAPAAYGAETIAGAAVANEENAETYGVYGIEDDNAALMAESAEDETVQEKSDSENLLKTNEAAATEMITMAATTTTASTTTAASTTAAPAAGDIDAGAAMNNDDYDLYEECADETPMLDEEQAAPIYDDAAYISNSVPDNAAEASDGDSAPAGDEFELTDKKLVLDGKLCWIVSLTPLDSIVWDGNRYISLNSGKEPGYTRLISKENLVGTVKRVDGEPQNELETDFFLDSELYRGDGLIFLTAKPTESLLRDELNKRELPKIDGIDSFTTDNVLLVYAVFRDSDYPDHNFIGSPEFNRYIS